MPKRYSKVRRVGGNIWSVGAGNPGSRPVLGANSASRKKG